MYAEIGRNIILSKAQYYISSYFRPRLGSNNYGKAIIVGTKRTLKYIIYFYLKKQSLFYSLIYFSLILWLLILMIVYDHQNQKP